MGNMLKSTKSMDTETNELGFFDWKFYLDKYSDLKKAGIDTCFF